MSTRTNYRRNINLLRAFLKRGRPADTIYALNSAAAQNLAIALREAAESCGMPVVAYKRRGSSAVFLIRLDAEPWREWREHWRDGRDGVAGFAHEFAVDKSNSRIEVEIEEVIP